MAFLALGAALCWGVADFIAGAQARRVAPVIVALMAQVVGLPIIALATAIEGKGIPAGDLLAVGLGMGLINAFAFYGVCASLAMGIMARVAPVFALSAVIPVVVGLAGGDDPAAWQLVGIVVALVGVLLVSMERERANVGRYADTRKAMLVALITATSIGIYLVGVDHVSEYSPYWAGLLARSTALTTLVVVTILFTTASVPTQGTYLVPLIVLGVLDTGANLLWAAASTAGLLSLVAVLGAIFPAVTVLLGLVLLRERLEPQQGVGVAATIAGCALITAA